VIFSTTHGVQERWHIGWLQRFLVVTAMLVQSPSLVGLILTGKSIAKFPELKERFAEYFLIGTLLRDWLFSAGWCSCSYGTEQCL
jgi:hypothetical protein